MLPVLEAILSEFGRRSSGTTTLFPRPRAVLNEPLTTRGSVPDELLQIQR